MKSSYWLTFFNTFRAGFGLVGTIIGLGLAVVAWLYQPTVKLGLGPVIILTCLLMVVTWTFALMSYDLWVKSTAEPRVVMAFKPSLAIENEPVTCLVEGYDFALDTLVTIYVVQDGGFEEEVSLGKVTHIQTDGMAQIAVLQTSRTQDPIITRLQQNDAAMIKRIKVRPTTPARSLDFQHLASREDGDPRNA